MLNYKFIETEVELRNICDDFLKEKVIGVDLEADSMYCFTEKICLIQIATAEQAFLIDPFELKGISPFLKILENPDIIKVFHGADFDIRSLDRDYQTRVNNLFDTEIACRFLGIKERGLGALLKKHFSIDSNKKYQKANWSKRPFNQGMIEYSVMDVAFLVKLYGIILEQLVNRGRLSWVKEEFEIQEQVRYENNHQSPLFKKFKGAGKIDNRSLAVLENLLQLRMQIAEKKDQPLFKIMSNSSLMAMAKEKPATIDQILEIRALSPRQADMYGKFCVETIIKAMELEQEQLPLYPKPKRPKKDVKVQNRIKKLKKMREKLSRSMGIEPGFLLNNAVIVSIALNPPDTLESLFKTENIRQWQVDNIGSDIISTIGYCNE
ncbi:MAG: HRDC domain-containing protein [Thermodesulfobacteriota bacterium]